ncbi:hypothetical protein IIB79_11570 [candidate division KSB1 bacterium]|nr:hypothetical protein [candidate division KSB1 bacterium]
MSEIDWKKRIRTSIEKLGYEVVDIRKEVRSKLDIIKIYIDSDSGVTLADCSNVSRFVNDEIFKYDLFTKDYRLEVSSPGIDRPLAGYKDFKRNITRKASVTFLENGKTVTITGTIKNANENEIIIQKSKDDITIEMNKIIEGKIVLPW